MSTPHSSDEVQERFDIRIARLAAAQHGVFSRSQVMRLDASKGMIQHRVTIGRWERLHRGVFRLAGTAQTWRQSLMATCLAWGDSVAISHLSAAALLRLASFEPGLVELTIPRSRKGHGPGIVHRNVLPAVDVIKVDGIPVTTPVRTLIDIAPLVPRDTLEVALDDALRRGLFSLRRLQWRLDQLGSRGRSGIALMRELLGLRDHSRAISQSVFETRLLQLFRRAGLPKPVTQYEIRNRGRLIAILDFAYPEAKLAIEADGEPWHTGRVWLQRDRTRGNRLTLLGWRVIHVTWEDLTRRPEVIVETVRQALTLHS